MGRLIEAAWRLNPHPDLAEACPYVSGVVDLDGTQGAGARMIVNIIDSKMSLRITVEAIGLVTALGYKRRLRALRAAHQRVSVPAAKPATLPTPPGWQRHNPPQP